MSRQLEPYNIECFEDPVLKHDLGWYGLLRQKLDIPLAIHLVDPKDVLQAVRAEAVDRFNLGGNVGNVLASHAIAESAQIPVWHQIAGLSLGIQAAFAIHVGCTLKQATLASDELPFIHENDLIGGALPVYEGHFEVPTDSGLGVGVDEGALRHYRVD